MASRVEITELARIDLKEIWSYIAEYSYDAANHAIEELSEKFRLLAENPSIGKNHSQLMVDIRSFPYKKYVIYYFPIENGVEIYRVIHGARNAENLFEDYFEGLKP